MCAEQPPLKQARHPISARQQVLAAPGTGAHDLAVIAGLDQPTISIPVIRQHLGLEWGRLYETYHKESYNQAKVSAEMQEIYEDSYVTDKKGIFEFILGRSKDKKLLNVRVFDDATKKSVYASQTKKAEAKGESNCPHCALGHDANKSKLWKLTDMDADHVTAWSKGGGTNNKNCQMLCKTHNRAKGNR